MKLSPRSMPGARGLPSRSISILTASLTQEAPCITANGRRRSMKLSPEACHHAPRWRNLPLQGTSAPVCPQLCGQSHRAKEGVRKAKEGRQVSELSSQQKSFSARVELPRDREAKEWVRKAKEGRQVSELSSQ